MATTTVIHFGSDVCQRVLVLRRAGYEVRELDSLDDLRLDLGSEAVDVVIVSEVEPSRAEQAAYVAREHSDAPLILFRDSSAVPDKGLFDLVFSSFTPGAQWLSETAVVIMQSKELRARSNRGRNCKEDFRLPYCSTMVQ
jgi:hypothetical protein